MIVFVILHYNNFEDTEKCIDSIIETSEIYDYKIVVVDNGSGNNSKEFFEQKYSNTENLEFIYNEKNLGFSAGNNVGCKYAIKTYSPDFLYVINNDTKIIDKNTISKIYQVYEEKQFDILGPQIFDVVSNTNLNPSKSPGGVDEVKIYLKRLKLCKKMLFFGSFACRASYVLHRIFWPKGKYSGFGLCGAALIFSRKYYERFSDIFVERTFIYGEESYLKYREQKYNLKMIYDDRISIEHFGSKSTKKMFTSKKKILEFKINANLKAVNKLIEAYEKDLDL